MKSLIKKFIPKFLFGWYHFSLAFLGAVFYGFPSRKMTVIGVTGTKGKTTTCNLIAQILNFSGLKTGMASTVNFRIGDEEWLNPTKQTMLGRFKLQKLLKRMQKEGCECAVVETSSEGILQHRHRFVDYDIAVFTNLSAEHIERHGGFENYRKAKLLLFEKVSREKDGVGIYNLDDENADYFLKPAILKKFGYSLGQPRSSRGSNLSIVKAENLKLSVRGLSFSAGGTELNFKLLGKFNAYNALAAATAALSQNISLEKIKEAAPLLKPPPGRLEIIDEGQDFTAIVDYSYEPKSLENALETIKIFNPARIMAVFGSAGGGRDKWRRSVMGEIAGKRADLVIVTTDDPYDEDPVVISREILKGVFKSGKRVMNEDVFEIADRREAIKKAIDLAQKNDLILFAGKGGEQWMNIAGGKKIPWDEAGIVREELKNLIS